MFAPFPENQAFLICTKMINDIENGSLELKQITEVSSERNDHGVMLGAAVCRDDKGHFFILKAVSGIAKQLVHIANYPDNEIIVPPLVSSEEISQALSKNDREIHLLTDKIKQLKEKRRLPDGKCLNQTEEEVLLCQKRNALCNESLKNVYELYSFHCADGKVRKLVEICPNNLPPTGTGDCCAPKLLNFAFSNNWSVVSMAETFFGKSTSSKDQGKIYSPCDERCGLILPEILGLNILYQDEHIVVVNKQSGVLSVPGRGPEKQDCIVNRLKRLFPECIQQPSVHRLDMETSGLMVLALTESAHKELNRQFEQREVKKEYEAVLDGKVSYPEEGQMELFFRVDLENRPHQMWDPVYGKSAVTQWQILGNEEYTHPDGKKVLATRVRFIPHTGRTHQLRLASANEHGFGIPIVGDTLYGTCQPGERLLLHAKYLCFKHPATGELMEFFCNPDF